MPNRPIQFAAHAYQARSGMLSAQRCLNAYAETSPRDGASPVAVYGAPGIVQFADVGNPVVGIHRFEKTGRVFVAAGQQLFSLDLDGTVTSRGHMPDLEWARMADNGTQLVVATNSRGYVWSQAAGMVEITDPDYDPAGILDVGFLDGYFVWVRDTGEVFISAINDGSSYDALDFATAEGSPDGLVGLAIDHREAWLFGTQSTELWYNAGTSPFPLARRQSPFIERGAGARGSIVKADNTLYWLGEDKGIFRADGYTPKRISTYAIEYQIGRLQDVSDCQAWSYVEGGHTFIAFNFPGGGRTFVFDVSTNLWHERESYGYEGWRALYGIRAYNGTVVTDRLSGRIGRLDADTHTEWADHMLWELVSNEQNPENLGMSAPLICSRLELVLDTGQAPLTGQGSDPTIWLDWSDDGGKTWSLRKPARSYFARGEYGMHVVWTRLGQFKHRIWRVRISDPVVRNLISAFADYTPGSPPGHSGADLRNAR